MKKIIALIFALFLISCAIQYSGKESSFPVTANQGHVSINIIPRPDCSVIKEAGQRDLCYLEEIKSLKNVTTCDKLTDYDLTIKCYADVASLTKNPNVCVKLTTDQWRDDCYFAAAKAKKDPAICASIIFADKRISCYRSFNLEEYDKFEICSQIWTKEIKSECYNQFN